ncbi:MAG: serine/threonine-protein kinase [Prevotellaceae bacterium]|nr:serine/threonine protein kinase [Prevotella sp.]MDD7605112.1 serine/threonine-protein kinase [Prevotellaceae bacterium]
MKQIDDFLPIGSVLHNRYEIEKFLSSGGFGNAYLVKDIITDRKYVIKEYYMHDFCQRDNDDKTVKITNVHNEKIVLTQGNKFKKEALRLQKIKSPHIVRVYDLFEENNTSYYVMDYIAGKNLSERLNDRGRPYSERTVQKFLRQLLDGLQAIHDIQIYHLDLKPSNIMTDAHGNLKLIDFGASKQIKSEGLNTESTAVCYTKGFAPIEQLAQNIEKFGPWTDFYALGAVLYQLMTNQTPPTVDELQSDNTKDKHLSLRLLGISKEMRDLILWMMTIDSSKRPQSVSEINQRLKSKVTESVHNPISASSPTVIIGTRGSGKVNESIAKENEEGYKEDDCIIMDGENSKIINVCFYPKIYQLYRNILIFSALLCVGSLWAVVKNKTAILPPMLLVLVFIAYACYIRWMLLHRKPNSIIHVRSFLVYEVLMAIGCFAQNDFLGGIVFLYFVIYGFVQLQSDEIDTVFSEEYRSTKWVDYIIVFIPFLAFIFLLILL